MEACAPIRRAMSNDKHYSLVLPVLPEVKQVFV